MDEPKKIRLGIVGLGNMGSTHALYAKEMSTVNLVGVCDINKQRADNIAAQANTKAYYDYKELLKHIDALLIAVPHYDHTQMCTDCFEKGVHVLCEKPLGVHTNDNKKVLDAYAKTKNLVFGIMYQERLNPFYIKIKDILDGGELGKLTRVTWVNTTWFRSQTYYDSGGWRATWAGEGGGILTNQCPHNLDTYCWLFGLPNRVTGFANIGKYHNIEVEDEVTAYFEHDNNMIGHFIVTTAETPGTNRFEIVGENGRLVYENNELIFYRNRGSMLDFSRTTKVSFGKIECWKTEIPVPQNLPTGHKVVTEKFIETILTGKDILVAHGTEGFNPVVLANAIMLSSFDKCTVVTTTNANIADIAERFENKLRELIKNSKFEKQVSEGVSVNMAESYGN